MKQVLLAIVVIVVVASLGVVGTYAGFVDTEVSEGNTFQAGSIDLQLGDTITGGEGVASFILDEDYGEDPLGDSVSETWHFEPIYSGGMQPGDWLESRVFLRNFGTMEGDSLTIDCVNVNYDEYNNPTNVPKDAVMVIDYLKYYNSPLVDIVWNGGASWDTNYIIDIDSDGRITLHDLEVHGISGLDAPPLVDGVAPEWALLDMKVVFDPPAIGDISHPYWRFDQYASFQTNMTLIFTLK